MGKFVRVACINRISEYELHERHYWVYNGILNIHTVCNLFPEKIIRVACTVHTPKNENSIKQHVQN